jgi:SAM-dependent methyltransferase
MMRSPLPSSDVERLTRERLDPQPTQCDYLHLLTLRDGLRRAFAVLDVPDGPVLDLYCGSQPYRSVIPWRPLWGVDIDRHFGGADVVGGIPLPFRDDTFAVVVCTQALYLVDDPSAAVREMHRVVVPGGCAVVTVPFIFRRESRVDRRYRRADLARLFHEWERPTILDAGGPAAGSAYYVGRLANGAARRWASARRALPTFAVGMNRVASVLDRVLEPVARIWPASFILIARRADG